MDLKVYQYQQTPICFNIGNGDIMVNATQMAKPFGKLPAHFLANQQTKEFLDVLHSRYRNSDNASEILRVVQGGVEQGTWMHQKLALKFAGWLSPEFELWVYDRIEELLTKGKVEITHRSQEEIIAEGYALALKAAEQYRQQLQLAESTIQKQAPIVEYATRVLDSEGTIPTTVVASDLGRSAQWVNQKLKEKGIIWKVGGVWVLTAKYKDKDYAVTKTFPYTDALGVQRTRQLTYWTEKGRRFVIETLSK